ncbi:uncharacterized protein LOC124810299 [Hydra vulgaris]|uniref:uncharacterized protein LOC124810299 n=1 Tax=Hydra vulgaris TaxID=6087 RepID=UPI0032EA841E
MERHIKNIHKSSEDAQASIRTGNSFCLDCGFQSRRITDLRKHLSSSHCFTFQKELLSFSNLIDFEKWKSDIELSCLSQYIVTSGGKVCKDGTRKIDKNCTSTLKVTCSNTQVVVNACYSHYGHQTEIQHLSLTKCQKREIAAKLQIGITKDYILDEIRDEIVVQRHPNDQDSVAAWLKEWQMKENNPILHYKLQGEPDTSHQFEVSDFIIIIQTEHQKNMFQQFGRAGVCIDSTHGTNGYDFLLTTLLVVDELGEGQPAGWCLATSDSFNFMKLFFGKLKENSGNIYPIWIMTDMAAQYYDAFCNVYTCAPLKL